MPAMVTPDMRRQAKAVNFGVIYGISPFGLARNLKISQGKAKRFIENYFAQYPDVKAWIDATLEQAAADGYVKTLLNRRRYVAGLTSGNVNEKRAAERVAITTPVQGTAADVIKLAMVRLDGGLCPNSRVSVDNAPTRSSVSSMVAIRWSSRSSPVSA